MPESLPQSFLPLTESTFAILLSLATGIKHGYAIMKDVEQLSNGRYRLSTSTLYTALSRLQDQGLIQRIQNKDADTNPGLPRKAYSLSALGRRVLEAETQRMHTLVLEAQLRLIEQNV